MSYTVTVTGVTRAADGEPLSTSVASFTGTALKLPTVTNVMVQTTAPSNGTTFYNTGTATVRVTGTEFAGVVCPTGVALDDLDGIGVAVGTRPTSCTVDSGTQITATFPAGIRTNGTLGWNVKVTNAVGTNATSTLRLVPHAGLLVSEVLHGVSGIGQNRREFVELYNPTGNALDVSATGVGIAIHMRTAAGVDATPALTFLSPASHQTIASHGFLLIASTQTLAVDAWFGHRDATYDATTIELVANGGVYVSLSATANAKVIDKVGWGNQPAGGFETKALGNITADNSAQRKPAAGGGAATDVDNNFTDFLAPTTTTTPQGTADPTAP